MIFNCLDVSKLYYQLFFVAVNTLKLFRTNLSGFFISKGGAGPLAWPRGSNEEPAKLTQY